MDFPIVPLKVDTIKVLYENHSVTKLLLVCFPFAFK